MHAVDGSKAGTEVSSQAGFYGPGRVAVVGSRIMASHRCPHILIPTACEFVTSDFKRDECYVRCEYAKDFEKRLSWINSAPDIISRILVSKREEAAESEKM